MAVNPEAGIILYSEQESKQSKALMLRCQAVVHKEICRTIGAIVNPSCSRSQLEARI